MTFTMTWNAGQSTVMFTPRLRIALGLIGLLALGLFTLIALLLAGLAALVVLLWVSITALLTTPFVVPTLSILLMAVLATLSLLLIGKHLLTLVREYQATNTRKAGVA